MKRKLCFILCYCWCLLLALAGAYVLLFADGGIYSEKENRTLTARPAFTAASWLDGSFVDEAERFLADGFPKRDAVLDASASMLDVFNVQSDAERIQNNDLIDELDAMANETPAESQAPADVTAAPSATPIESQAPADATAAPDQPVDPNASYRSFYLQPSGAKNTIFQFDQPDIERAAATLNAYRAALDEDGVVFFTQTPYSTQANNWLLNPTRFCGWGSEVEPALQACVDEGVYIINATDLLCEPMQNGELVFFKTDHHWAGLGACYVEQSMMETLGVPYVAYSDYAYTIHERFFGSISSEVNLRDGDRLEVPSPLAPTRAYEYRYLDRLWREVRYMEPERTSYSAFLGGTHTPFLLIQTGFHTGRNALVICDSFGNAFITYLVPYYDTVGQLDLRPSNPFTLQGGASVREYIETYDIDDIYFVSATGCGINSYFFQHTVLPLFDEGG